MRQSLEPKQVQKLSPQMIQSMAILQMGTQELREYTESLMLENPVLERDADRERYGAPAPARKTSWLKTTDPKNRRYYQDDANDPLENTAAPAYETLYEHLSSQLDTRGLSPALRRALDCVLTGLDGNGYLEETTEELAARCGQSVGTVAAAEAMLRRLEPAGVGARGLSECLVLQLQRLGGRPLAVRIARDCLEDMARDRYALIAKKTDSTQDAVREACRLIRSLEPRPGRAFSVPEAAEYVTPDLVVTREDGKLRLSVNDGDLPPLKISAYYRELLRGSADPQVRDYLAEKLRQANWVLKSIAQRRETLLLCARSIVARQEEFFLRGGHLAPMSLADVAAEIGVHESTVSRAVKDKYLQCPRGMFPLGWFFSRAMPAGGGDVSPERIKTALKALIEGEDRRRPLSDRRLCELLNARGLPLARRTVAKYREEAGVPAAARRKEIG